jgi:hypothetical protein
VIDLLAVHLALQNRALSVVIATTGSIALSATATGYARTPLAGSGTLAATTGAGTFSTTQAGVIVNGSVVTVAGTNYVVSNFNGTTGCTLSGAPSFAAAAFTYTGSFIVDGLDKGMEITPTGFAANTVGVIASVTARTITTGARSVETSASGRTISVGFPSQRALENVPLSNPDVTRPYVEEDFVPATTTLMGSKTGGSVEETGLYVLKWYGLPGIGETALRKSAHALKLLFAPGTRLTAGSDTVSVRGDVGPQTGQIIPLTGWSVLVLTIPWRAYTQNVVAA